jgi:hypothetical protein
MKFTYLMGTSSTPLKLFFHKFSFVINTLFPPWRDMLCAGRVKLFSETSVLFARAVFQLVIVRKNGVLGVHTSWG